MAFIRTFFILHRHIFLYGFSLAILVFLLKWLQWKLLVVDNSLEIYIGIIAVFFTVLGTWIATQLATPKKETIIIEKKISVVAEAEFVMNEAELEKLNLTNREYAILQLLAKGYSNSEIAESLFLSLSTVKTHVSNLFVKMDVKSRAQAIARSRALRITP